MPQCKSPTITEATAKVFTFADDRAEFFTAMHAGKRCQIDQEMYDYFLDVLPPIFMGSRVQLIDGTQVRADFGFAEGQAPIEAFWRQAGEYFAQRTTRIAEGR